MSEALETLPTEPAAGIDQPQNFGWIAIVRLGLVQTSIGAIVVLMTSTLNRVMTVELMLPAMLPGALVALHYAIQLSRPGFGHASDRSGRRTPWILIGLTILAIGAVLAASATALLETNRLRGVVLAAFAFAAIGAGVGAAGTSLLALLAAQVPDSRRAAAGSIVWIMMIVGFVLTTVIAGAFLDPFSVGRLVLVTSVVAGVALTVSMLALFRLEPARPAIAAAASAAQPPASTQADFKEALGNIWRDTKARQFTVFVFVSMLAYSTQDLILEPFAGLVFGMTPGQSTQLAGTQNQGVLLGMILIAVCGTRFAGSWLGSLRFWTVAGCLGSALALLALALASQSGPPWPLARSVFMLGLANGMFAVAAIASMMALAGAGPVGQEGMRMGVWGAAQAIAFALGGFLGTALYDVLRAFAVDNSTAYAVIFLGEATIFLLAAWLAAGIKPLTKNSGIAQELRSDAIWRLQS